MKLEKIFPPCDQADPVAAATKRQALGAVAAACATCHGLDEKRVFEVLNERERLGSTAIGGGVAIPHGKLSGLTEPRGCIVRLTTPVDFDAHDGAKVDIVVALLAPDTGGAEHLRVLARLSRRLRNPQNLSELRACPDSESLRAAIAFEAEEKNAA